MGCSKGPGTDPARRTRGSLGEWFEQPGQQVCLLGFPIAMHVPRSEVQEGNISYFIS